jgi:hypothetical protein
MNVDQEIDHTHRLIILTLSGELTDQDLLGLADRMGKASVSRDFSLLIDLRFANGTQVTTEGVHKLAAKPLVLAPQSRRAVVVPSPLGFGMARMYEMLRGKDGAARVFIDYDEARRWVETGKA